MAKQMCMGRNIERTLALTEESGEKDRPMRTEIAEDMWKNSIKAVKTISVCVGRWRIKYMWLNLFIVILLGMN